MSTSASQSKSETSTTNQQFSLQGSSGSGDSPTVGAGGNVTINSAGGKVALQSLQNMTDVIQAVLKGQNEITGKSLENTAAVTTQNGDLLSAVLKANQTLAQNNQSGGATAAIKQTNFIIWGLIGLAGLALFFFLRKR